MKKLLSIMLAAFMVMGMFSVVVLADADITISTADELISWAADSDNNSGKTVALAADIALTGTWTPKAEFAGTFDGQGHKISGLNGAQGLVTKASGATFNGLSIVDSTITTEVMNVGAFAGTAIGCTFVDCYTNVAATSTTNNIGGFVGQTSTTVNTFTGCWFDGDVHSDQRYISGFIGNNQSTPCVFTDCLSTGKVSAVPNDAIIAAFAGAIYGGKIEATNCLVGGGSLTAPVGAAFAYRDNAPVESKFVNCYALEGFAPKLDIETNDQSKAGQVEWIKAEDITVDKMGAAWGESTDGKVVPAAFAAPFEGAEISTWDELVAWAADEKNIGEDARIIADITAPADATWTAKARFDGVLDGMGHTISGLKGGKALIQLTEGATIKNLFITDSEFTTESTHAAVFVAQPAGTTFENLYTNGKVVGVNHCGGIAGHGNKGSVEDPTNTFISCWFDGEIQLSATYASGIMGNQESLPNVFTDCLNTGKIIARNNIAGISASVYDGSAVVTRCVNLGEVRKVDNGEDKGLAAAIVWTVTARNGLTGSAELVDCYNLKDKAVTKPGDVREGATLTGEVVEVPSLEDLSVFSALKGNWKVITVTDDAGTAAKIVVPNYFAKDGEEIPDPAPVTAAPTTAAPSTAAPTAAPTTAAPSTAAPTEAPSTAAPTEAPASTAAPTEAPATEAPATAAPTEAPASATASEAPASQAPVTADGVTVFMIVALVLSAGAFVVVSKARARV